MRSLLELMNHFSWDSQSLEKDAYIPGFLKAYLQHKDAYPGISEYATGLTDNLEMIKYSKWGASVFFTSWLSLGANPND